MERGGEREGGRKGGTKGENIIQEGQKTKRREDTERNRRETGLFNQNLE